MVALLLPGMSLNATIFPALTIPTVTADFSRLILGPDGSSRELLERRMGVYVDLLDAELARHAAWQSPYRVVVGHSFGGMLAMAWWLRHGGAGPARVDGMVLCATTAGPLFRGARLGRLPLAPIMPFWNRPFITRTIKRLFAGALDRTDRVDFQSIARPTDITVDLMGWRNTDWRAMRSYRLALAGFDIRARLPEITVPVTVLHGDRDPILPATLGEALAAGLPRGKFVLVKGAGHALPLTNGAAVQEALTSL